MNLNRLLGRLALSGCCAMKNTVKQAFGRILPYFAHAIHDDFTGNIDVTDCRLPLQRCRAVHFAYFEIVTVKQ